ncbi:hypothetical protein V6N13_119746 [Hibiscus sabdariffa]
MEELTGFPQMRAPVFPEHEHLKCPRCDSTNTKFCYYNNYNLSQPRHFCRNCRRYWTKGGSLRNIPVGGGTRKNTKRSSSNNCNQPKRQSNPATEPAPNQKLPDPDPSPPPPPASSTIPQQGLESSAVQNSVPDADRARMYVLSLDHQERNMMDSGGSFRSLLASRDQFGNLLNGLNSNGSGSETARMDSLSFGLDTGSDRDPSLGNRNYSSKENEERYLGRQGGGGGGGEGDTSCWGGGSNGWPELAIYTPGSSFD